MLAVPCPIPVPGPPAAYSSVEWKQEADFWRSQWLYATHGKNGLTVVRFKSFYCRSDYAHLVASALGGK